MLTSNGYVLSSTPDRLGTLEPVPAADRGSRDALWERLDRDGCLLLRGFLDPDIVNAFRHYYFGRLADAGLREHGDGDVDQAALRRILFREIVPGLEYDAFCRQSVIVDFFSWLLGDDVHLHRRKIIRHTRPGDSGIGQATQAHYDLLYLREGTDDVLTLWVPLGDCPVSRGGLIYLEGSHRWVSAEEQSGVRKRPAASITADLPGLADDHDARWLVTDYAAGDVLVHTAHMVHAALDNVDPQQVMRLSTDIRYQRVSDAIDARWQNHWHNRDGL
ncbi:phytanoyl-CoA dioxygenase family protein [Microlunatus sp. Gsoil 973]|uniref:phytanoyl-CoA dioxygenase family protein n=1 Tax=Microlunatus sp. Gsoil 973 TaxID=2672569 RepID=UPI0012B5025C|nr:phytanoyl-CoA dioxygenase family protein [Microlunatus sp. Gsoil 973]QGN31519.1 phytanoyl-CoA dioxygenase [Microlunatus sp. Gsoil 973]